MCPFRETVPRKTNYAPNEKKKKKMSTEIFPFVYYYITVARRTKCIQVSIENLDRMTRTLLQNNI